MRRHPKALLIAGFMTAALTSPIAHAADAPAGEAMPSLKLSVFSEYEYRGISQTSEKPAGQLNIDWAHSSGFYLGTFVSNIKWLKDAADVGGFSTSANLEWDIFGGYKYEIAKDVIVDAGYLRYEYPSSGAFNPKPNTDEFYLGVGYGPVSVKYSRSTSNLFGVADSKGSDFIEANLSYPLSEKLALTANIGHQKYKNNKAFDYTVYKLGLAYDVGSGWGVGAYVKDTDADPAAWTVKGKDWSKSRLVAFASYTF